MTFLIVWLCRRRSQRVEKTLKPVPLFGSLAGEDLELLELAATCEVFCFLKINDSSLTLWWWCFLPDFLRESCGADTRCSSVLHLHSWFLNECNLAGIHIFYTRLTGLPICGPETTDLKRPGSSLSIVNATSLIIWKRFSKRSADVLEKLNLLPALRWGGTMRLFKGISSITLGGSGSALSLSHTFFLLSLLTLSAQTRYKDSNMEANS